MSGRNNRDGILAVTGPNQHGIVTFATRLDYHEELGQSLVHLEKLLAFECMQNNGTYDIDLNGESGAIIVTITVETMALLHWQDDVVCWFVMAGIWDDMIICPVTIPEHMQAGEIISWSRLLRPR